MTWTVIPVGSAIVNSPYLIYQSAALGTLTSVPSLAALNQSQLLKPLFQSKSTLPPSQVPPRNNAGPMEHFKYWLQVVTNNEMLHPKAASILAEQTSLLPTQKTVSVTTQQTTLLPHKQTALFSTPAPTAPIHLPYQAKCHYEEGSCKGVSCEGGSCVDIRTTRPLLSKAKSVQDVIDAEPLYYVGKSGQRLLCKCCVSTAGFTIPQTTFAASKTIQDRWILTEPWRNFKNTVRRHLRLPSHVKKSKSYYRQLQRPCAVFEEHSIQFKPDIVDSAMDVLEEAVSSCFS